jgi:AcrR family transcriptional regulator
MAVSRRQRNEVLHAIEAARLRPTDFRWGDSEPVVGSTDTGDRRRQHQLVHEPTGAFFLFESPVDSQQVPDGRRTAFLRAFGAWLAEPPVSPWNAQLRRFSTWLSNLTDDLGTPDLWAELGQDQQLFAAASDGNIDNSPFTSDERDEIARQLALLLNAARTSYALSDHQLRLLDARVAQLVDASSRLGRKDWVAMFLGIMLTLVITSVLPSDVVQQLIGAFAQGVRHLFTSGPLQLPPAP